MSAISHPGGLGVGAIPRRRLRAIPRKRGLSWRKVAAYVFCVAVLSFIAQQSFAFFGFLAIERVRELASRADKRVAGAEAAVIELHRQIDDMQASSTVERWAEMNGFFTTYAMSDETAQD